MPFHTGIQVAQHHKNCTQRSTRACPTSFVVFVPVSPKFFPELVFILRLQCIVFLIYCSWDNICVCKTDMLHIHLHVFHTQITWSSLIFRIAALSPQQFYYFYILLFVIATTDRVLMCRNMTPRTHHPL